MTDVLAICTITVLIIIGFPMVLLFVCLMIGSFVDIITTSFGIYCNIFRWIKGKIIKDEDI